MSDYQQQEQQQGLELVLLRNAFYRDHYHRALLAFLLLLLINVLLISGIVYKITHPQPPQYFATTAEGRMINIHPLSDPVVTDSYVLQWTANAVRSAFSQDYLHWREQLQQVSDNFTPSGWRYFLNSMQKSNNLKTLISLKMVSNAEITGAPSIQEKEVVGDHYAWKIDIPIVVTYNNAQRTITVPMDVTLIVLRMPVQDYPQRIAINNFLPVVQNNSEEQLFFQG